MLALEQASMPTYRRNDEDVPLIGCYPFQDKGTYSIVLTSRKLDGTHGGNDFGDGYTPVSIELPFKKANSITLYRLTGDPRSNNRKTMNIEIEKVDIDATTLTSNTFTINETTGGGESGMPPGSIYLYVFETGETTAWMVE